MISRSLAIHFATIGIFLMAISSGSIFSRTFIPYSYWMLVIGILLVLVEIPTILKREPARTTILMSGVVLLALVLGAQSPHIPFMPHIFFIGFFAAVFSTSAVFYLHNT